MIKRFFYTLKQAFLQVFRNRAMSLASIFAITAMLLILGIFFILVINVNTSSAQTIESGLRLHRDIPERGCDDGAEGCDHK